ncbi:hypothetical protein ACHBTE_11290 [Streptomyces sp. M41]|uniref:hypothetical protein n=1 Tax=Streptomyces sp. M41 TaxID=3059412 RepID=UPI00374CDBA2
MAVEEQHDDESAPPPVPSTPAEWDALITDWDEIRQGYHLGDARRAVLECASRLEASTAADGPDTALWTLGLVLIGPYVIYARPDAAAEARVLAALSGVERALAPRTCAHGEHPCDDVAPDDELDDLRHVLQMLARPERDSAGAADGTRTALGSNDGSEDGSGDEADDETGDWFEGRMTREIWACPQNLAGFARAFADA